MTVVLLPSLGRAATDFDRLADDLRAAGYGVIAVDLPGVGAAASLPVGEDLHQIATDVVARIAAAQTAAGASGPTPADGSTPPFDLLGHAYGNRIARCIAADHPGLVRSLVLLGCGGKVPGDPAARAALGRCFSLPEGTPAHRVAVREAFFAPTSEVPESWTVGWWPEAAAAQSRASAATPVDDWWIPPEPVPVLAVVGADDRISPPENARALAGELGGRGRVEIVAAAGHALLPERPTALADAVAGFLSGLDS